MEKLSVGEKHGRRRQITFRIGPICEDRLRRAAALFNMKSTDYAKAIIYKDLGIFDEPLDKRRSSWKRHKKKQQLEEEEEQPLEIEKHKDF
jgi:hypothetical protein